MSDPIEETIKAMVTKFAAEGVDPDEMCVYMPDGWHFGSKVSEETRQRLLAEEAAALADLEENSK